LYSLTPTDEWTQVNIEGGDGQSIDPIEWTGEDEEFSVKITDEEVKLLMDDNDEIGFEKVFEWCLPRFGDDDSETLFEYQVPRMQNYMRKRVVEDDYKPKYSTGDDVIKADHVARFYGACLGKMLMGNISIEQIFSTREIFNAIPSIQVSMTKNAYLEEMTGCLHCNDDWELMGDGVWADTYIDAKVEADSSTASHRLKHGRLEDGYNKVCTVVCCCCCCYCFESISKLHPPILSSYVAVASHSSSGKMDHN
jgi:hypothetical protein